MNSVQTDTLARLLDEPVESVLDRERGALTMLLEESRGQVVLFGAGGLGTQVLECLRGIGVEPLAFSDNDASRWGNTIGGVTVLPPDDAVQRFGGSALFIVTIWNPYHWFRETEQSLSDRGCRRVVSPSPAYWRFADALLPFYAQDLPHKILPHRDAVLEASRLWSDEHSSAEFARQISWRFAGTWNFTRPDDRRSYLRDDLFRPDADESFIDCGAYDGDTLRDFLKDRGDTFRHFLALEPDSATYKKLCTSVSALPSSTRAKVRTLNAAVGATRTELRFTATGTMTSHGSSSADEVVSCVPLAELAADIPRPVTFIKMDIEGAEFDALQGAATLIKDDEPLLAVCVYHIQHDIWRIPLLIRSLVPAHKLYLRCHEGDGWQTVAYAVPPTRALSR
jgi:FkbM family methyltransferase